MSHEIIARFKATDLNANTMRLLAQNRVLEFIRRHELSEPTKDFITTLNTYCAQASGAEPVEGFRPHMFLGAYLMAYFPTLITPQNDAPGLSLVAAAREIVMIVDSAIESYNAFEEMPQNTAVVIHRAMKKYKEQHEKWCLADKSQAVKQAIRVLRMSYQQEELMSDDVFNGYNSSIKSLRKFIIRFGQKSQIDHLFPIHVG
jgi:hypothetical protein